MSEYNINMELLEEKISAPKTAIHCDDKSKSVALLEALKELGYVWSDGDDLSIKSMYAEYMQETCYDSCYRRLKYGSKRYYKDVLCYEIVEFDDLIIEPTIDTESFCNFLGGQ